MTALFEGVGIALTSLRAHKMRAALTILGVAIGVTVVMVIGAMISGFNKGISDMLASLGPKTFWVGRYWGGQNDQDPEDPNPWRRRPPITVEEANRLAELPTIAFVVVDEYTSADIDFEGHRFAATAMPFGAATPTGPRSRAATSIRAGRSRTSRMQRTPMSPSSTPNWRKICSASATR